jgi:hypothetical protein
MKTSMKTLAISIALASTIAAGLPSSANATLITFDDLTAGLAVANGYNGLDWSYVNGKSTTSFYVLNSALSKYSSTGYANADVSATNVAYNAYGATAEISTATSPSFTLNSGYFTGAYNDGLSITAQATTVGGLTETQTFKVNTTGPTKEVFNFGKITSISFISSGGTTKTGLSCSACNVFAMDNLTINAPVPEPETYGMMLAGLGLMGFMIRRKSSV